MTRMGVEIESSLSQFEGTADEARFSLYMTSKSKYIVKFQIGVGHPLVDDELPEVPPG